MYDVWHHMAKLTDLQAHNASHSQRVLSLKIGYFLHATPLYAEIYIWLHGPMGGLCTRLVSFATFTAWQRWDGLQGTARSGEH